MSNNKEKILRDLEYVNGGVTAFKTLCNSEGKFASYYRMLDEWQDILCNIMDMIEEDYNHDATYS